MAAGGADRHIRCMRPPRPWLAPLLVFGVFTLLGLSKALHFWLDDLARAHAGTLPTRLIEELTGGYAGALLFAGLAWLVHRWPLTSDRWLARLPLYLAAILVGGVLHTTVMWLSRLALFPLAGLGPYDYGLMRYRYPMEFALQLPSSVIIILLLHGWRRYRESRERELHASRLEAELGRARLARLEAQLDPHFLFNTLNGISSLMYSDAPRADRMLARLAELLRLNFSRDGASEVTLEQELAWLEAYLEIARLRFGDRLTITTTIAADTLDCRVPRLILQPLVENALEHGVERRAGPATVAISAVRAGGRLTLAVADDGPGLHAGAGDTGVGLANTRARLGVLHGAAAALRIGERAGGGVEVRLELPALAGAAP